MAATNRRTKVVWWSVFVTFSLPFMYLCSLIYRQELGPDPGEIITRFAGEWSLTVLTVCLSVTPVKQLFKWRWAVKYRRMIGLYAWFYAVLHVCAASLLVLDISIIGQELFKRPYILVGFIAFVILSVLAATSPKIMVKRLGKRWKVLHRGVYVAALLILVHYFWLTRVDYSEPVFYGFLLFLLLGYRVCRNVWIWISQLNKLSGQA